MLLRKKLEPGVETWVEEGRGVGKTVGEGMERELERMWLYGGGLVAMKEKERGEREEERGSLWEELEGESDEDEDEEMEDVEVEGEGKSVNEKAAKDAAVGGKPDPTKPARTVEQMARFMAAGVMP